MLDVLRRAALLAAREVLRGCVVALGGGEEVSASTVAHSAEQLAHAASSEAAEALALARENEAKIAAIATWASDAVAEADALRNGVEEKHWAPEENYYVSIGLVPTRALVSSLGANVEAQR